jgi:two-component system sensor histidine kinase/response regulator
MNDRSEHVLSAGRKELGSRADCMPEEALKTQKQAEALPEKGKDIAQPRATEMDHPSPRLAESKVNILLVDDAPANLLALEALLDDLGQNLVRANSGEEALRQLLRQDFAVILLDVKMEGMDGFETAELIRKREKSRYTPIIFLTAHQEFPMRKGYELGAVDYLIKPLVPEILRAKVRGFVELSHKTEQVKRQAERLRQAEREEFERRLAEEKLRQTEERYREIARLNTELEQRVVARTRELEEANQGLAREVAERQRAASALERSNRDLEQFAYVASHDLKEPLRKMRIYLELLQRRYQGRLEAEADQYIQLAVQASARMRALVNDLLAYARVGSNERPLERIDCSEVLQQALANLQTVIEEKHAQVTHDRLPVVKGDAIQLVQLFENLVSNALKFNQAQAPSVHVGVERQDDHWRFSVRDNGIGIDPRYAERIFIIFERLHSQEEYPGTGIGLAICKRIVERHHGCIGVESEPGKGATFWFTLPCAPGD